MNVTAKAAELRRTDPARYATTAHCIASLYSAGFPDVPLDETPTVTTVSDLSPGDVIVYTGRGPATAREAAWLRWGGVFRVVDVIGGKARTVTLPRDLALWGITPLGWDNTHPYKATIPAPRGMRIIKSGDDVDALRTRVLAEIDALGVTL